MTSLKRLGFCALLFVGLIILAGFIIPYIGTTCTLSAKSPDSSNLRQIAQASLIYAQDNHDRFPEATDIWDYARLLAIGAAFTDSYFWQSRVDPACPPASPSSASILAPAIDNHSRALTPAFRALKPSIAVPLGKLTTAIPATTPIAWTRGLQPDGTWAKHSPYGGEGGYIAFADANVAYYRNLTDDGGQLTRFDGQGKTANILEALPPGTRIGEYVPTPEEQKAWSK